MTAARNAVDTHTHLSRWWRDIQETGYRRDIDYTLEGMLREMDAAGIDHSMLIQVNDAPSPPEGHAEARSLVAESKGRLSLISSANPTLGASAVEEMVALWDGTPELKGIKLFPGYNPFYPDDPRLDPIYEYAAQRGVPVLIHTGDTMDNWGHVKYSRPLPIDDIAVRFRDVRFVVCHLGNPWIDEAMEIIYKNPNVYGDTSGLLAHPSYPLFDRHVDLVRRRIQDAISMTGTAERVLYGSDWPLIDFRVATSLVTRLDLPERDREAILGGNARRLFGLPPPHGASRAGPS
jgi:predicted TIM-barrel fold metal-dependent hydrolase